MSYKPTDEDQTLWNHVTKGIRRFHKNKLSLTKETPPTEEPHKKSKPRQRVQEPRIPDPPPINKASAPNSEQTPQLNRRDEDRLRKGQMTIEATIDLHGLTQAQAFDQLHRFILQAVQQHYRCVLVITGKGRLSEPSILRRNLPEWLRHENLSPFILRCVPAHPKDGGNGAFYVYLRRAARHKPL